MITKYGFEIDQNTIDINVKRLTNQIWKLIPMREHEEDWEKQLNTIIIEIAGLGEIFNSAISFVILLSKLEGLKIVSVEFPEYRKTVFEAIGLLQDLKHYDK